MTNVERKLNYVIILMIFDSNLTEVVSYVDFTVVYVSRITWFPIANISSIHDRV